MTSNQAKVLPDTHTLVWHLLGSPRLSSQARDLMRAVDRGDADLVVPTIVPIEVLRLSERRLPEISLQRVLGYLSDMPNAVIADLDARVLEEVQMLSPALEMHDRIIAATARVYRAALVSRDRRLGDVVETVW